MFFCYTYFYSAFLYVFQFFIFSNKYFCLFWVNDFLFYSHRKCTNIGSKSRCLLLARTLLCVFCWFSMFYRDPECLDFTASSQKDNDYLLFTTALYWRLPNFKLKYLHSQTPYNSRTKIDLFRHLNSTVTVLHVFKK